MGYQIEFVGDHDAWEERGTLALMESIAGCMLSGERIEGYSVRKWVREAGRQLVRGGQAVGFCSSGVVYLARD